MAARPSYRRYSYFEKFTFAFAIALSRAPHSNH
jgi:hypothetical protein